MAKILICGGGTGGHIYPALAAVEALLGRGVMKEQILWIGTQGQMEETLVPRAGLLLMTIQGGPIAGVPLWTQVLNGLKLVAGYFKAWQIIRGFMPDVVFLTGGYVNLPVALAAARFTIPILTYLPDVEPGAAIKRLSRYSHKIACTTAGSKAFLPAEKLVVTGYPVRQEMRDAAAMPRTQALAHFNLTADRPTLFVFGGSRGARTINQALQAILPDLLQLAQVIHVTGTLDWPEVEAQTRALDPALRPFYRPFAYLHSDMALAYRAADLVLARSGAGMLGEAPAFGVGSVLVPYPYAWRYQKVNADYLADKGAAVRLNDEEMGTKLLPTLLALLSDREKLQVMGAAAKQLDVPDAVHRLAQAILDCGLPIDAPTGNRQSSIGKSL
ncbi:MAG: undecaprenyldiphospho-muramoylpentapeptide beta-N-acetylglucosaminyltransferase [Chloroflexi bacterium]|nr:undecaprenyldiphospho-muramoylpentapeptide beta-N-acetylglucosaminyltransferase [Chloroflexota bacterium]MBP8054872.1 undecaprenyldiphospho-muramoylpentapeptide beta-N-acetylglucosaminyltransferase [Chloroflexota bacterium]